MIGYCAYWGTYSRVLTFTDGPMGCPQVDVNLTPIPACSTSTWGNHVEPIRILAHGERYCPRDLEMKEPPPEILAKMVQNLGETLVHRLLTEDFLPQIDWDNYAKFNNGYAKFNNGGANLEDIRKD